jgi:hypothetical protein
MLLKRGIDVTYEAIRQWYFKFGQGYANQPRRRRPRSGDTWHLDDVFLTINGQRHYLWRAVDQDDNVLDILVQVRFVDQKPNLEKVWGIGPELKSSDAPKPENWVPVSVKFRPLLVRG